MYQLGLQVKKKKAEGGEFISPILNISKAQTPIYVQFYINTILQRIECLALANCLYTSMYTSSKCFLKAFENCKNHQWQIQDFLLGGCRPIGGVPTSNVYTFQQKHM